MRSGLFLAAAFLTCSLGLNKAQAQTQTALAFASTADYEVSSNTASETPANSKDSEKVVLTGKITNSTGVLPGAVVILTVSKQMAVTNAEGEFEFVVPANAGPLEARVTYGGYADEKMVLNASVAESTVSLTNARVIVVSRNQRLKKYLKTARKQIKHDLKQMRK